MTAVKFRKKVQWWLQGVGGKKENGGCLLGTDLQDQKGCGNLFHNNINIFNTTEPYI